MSATPLLRLVLDTDVVFEGLTRRGGASGTLVEAWLVGQIYVCVSDSLAYEYTDVLSRKLSAQRWERVKPVLAVLLSRAHLISIYYRWRPVSPDPGDDHVIDCAMNAGAMVVTANRRHFRTAEESLGLPVATATEAVCLLAGEAVPDESR
jgi:putative PIN family toxin of toxin-antitoxin system